MKLNLIGVMAMGLFLSCNTTSFLDLNYNKSVGRQITPIKDEYGVNIEFLIYNSEQKKSPVIIDAFMDAIGEWSKHIPIRAMIYFENEPIIPKLLRDSTAYRSGVIRIIVSDLQKAPYNADTGVIAFWDSSKGRILFDLDYFQENPAKAYSVALHELGHMFGVPHFINAEEDGYTSYIIVPSTAQAQDYVMYPTSFTDRPQVTLSWMEIKIANDQIWSIMTKQHKRAEDDCTFLVDNR